jgi:hypothetical protein
MSRDTRTDFPGAFRVVLVKGYGTTYVGPYQTLAAAKGQLSREQRYHGQDAGYIERTTGAWEKVEA